MQVKRGRIQPSPFYLHALGCTPRYRQRWPAPSRMGFDAGAMAIINVLRFAPGVSRYAAQAFSAAL